MNNENKNQNIIKKDKKDEKAGSSQGEKNDDISSYNFNPFEKRPKIGISPIRARSGSTGNIGTKRSREDEMEEVDYHREITKTVDRVGAVAISLKKVIDEHINTKSEIKSGIKEIHWLVDSIKRLMKEAGEAPVFVKKKAANTITESKGTQVGDGDITPFIEDIARTNIQTLQEKISTGRTFKDLEAILKEKWPEEVYQKTHSEEGSPLELGGEWDWLIMADHEDTGRGGLLKHIRQKHPEVVELLKVSAVGNVEYIADIKKTSKTEITPKEKYIYVIPHDTSTEDAEVYKSVEESLKMLKSMGRNKVAVMTTGKVENTIVRKMIEHVSINETIEWKILRPKGKATPKSHTNSKTQGDTVVIKTGTSSYSEMLKKMKQQLDMDSLGVTVKQVKKTSNGDVLMKITGEKEKLGLARKEIEKTLPSAQVTIKTNECAYNILDLDEVTTEEEVMECLVKQSGVDRKNLKIKGLRTSNRGSQSATVLVTKELAPQIDKLGGKIKVGWLRCRIKQKIQLVRCYRCLEYGHKTFECKGEDKKGNCMNCGKTGHLAKSCMEIAHCATCKMEGHRMDSMKCPRFKELIKKQGEKNRPRKQKRQTNVGETAQSS